MTPPFLRFDDAVRVVLVYLRPHLAVCPDPGPCDAYATVPDARPEVFVHVQRNGGPRRDFTTDQALIDVTCWASTDADAATLAEYTRAYLAQMRGTVAAAVVQRTAEVSGPVPFRDPQTGVPRVTFRIEVAMRSITIEE